MSGFAEFMLLVTIGALCSLDTVSIAQAMISRPIVSATLAGVALGGPADGLVIGAVLELFALETMPFGASRYPEWGAASVVAGATYVSAGSGTSGALALATLAGLGTAWLGSVSMVWHRELIGRIAARLREPLAGGSAVAVIRLQLSGIAADLWRGAAVSAVGLLGAVVMVPRLLLAWRLDFGPSVVVPIILAAAVGGSAVARAARASRGASWVLVGGLVAGALLVATR